MQPKENLAAMTGDLSRKLIPDAGYAERCRHFGQARRVAIDAREVGKVQLTGEIYSRREAGVQIYGDVAHTTS